MILMTVTLQNTSSHIFTDGIDHPDYYLWDAWSYQQDQTLHLYCLAVARFDGHGQLLDPTKRNGVPFHVRHFVSDDNGDSWLDQGNFQASRPEHNDFDSKSIWSSSITRLEDDTKLVAFTGLKASAEPQQFLQSMGLAISHDGYAIDADSIQLISSPEEHWQAITTKGYYIAEREQLGHRDGEEGGPILAWRDPFIIVHDQELHMFWCAKSASHTPALGHAKLNRSDNGFEIDYLYPPVLMPDGNNFTQLELPKVIYDDVHERFYLIIATCNRTFEGQPDSDVNKQIRLYQSSSLDGPWEAHFDSGSSTGLGAQHMFGMTVLSTDFVAGELHCISPYTEAADRPLSLSKTFTINL